MYGAIRGRCETGCCLISRRIALRDVIGVLRFSAILAVTFGFLVQGCSRSSTSHDVQTLTPNSTTDATPGNNAEESAVVIEHDFGFVRSGEKRKHTFRISNPTARTWTLRKVITMCRCAVASVSASSVPPDGTLDVTVTYLAGNIAVNDRRRVVVVFREQDVPPVVLRVLAEVRPPLTLTNSNIAFVDVGRGQVRKRRIEVQNYDLNDWTNVRATTTAKWLSCRVRRAEPATDDTNLRQRYLVEITAHGANSSQPQQESRILIEAIGQNGEVVHHRSVPVTMTTTPAVTVVPRHLLFRDVQPGRDSVSTVLVRFSEDSVPGAPSEINFTHTLGNHLRIDWESTTGRAWTLRAVLNCSVLPTGETKLIITFRDDRIPAVELPVYVFSTNSGDALEDARQ